MKKSLITLIIVSAAFLILASCASPEKYSWRYEGKTESQARQEEAECQLMAKQARNESGGDPYWGDKGGTTVYEHEGNYYRYSQTYSGKTTVTNEPDYLGIMFDEFAKNADEREVYELCMESKGFYKVSVQKKKDNPLNSIGRYGERCSRHAQCGDGLGCFDNICITFTETRKLENRTNKGETCNNSFDCKGGYFCNDGICTNSKEYKAEHKKSK